MPLYSYHCPTCGRDAEQFNKIATRQHGPDCCGAPMAQQLTACMVSVRSFDSYVCPMTDKVIQSERARKYAMDKENVVDAREFKDTWAKNRKKRAEENAAAKKHYDALPDSVKKAAAATA